ncbi:sensor histidine kinase [Clostridium senegalense]|uniref:ATP-binding protein n=1 Tax=Clostridium senegalense TaxID=1465809 RepID=UPI001C115A5C|nr:ATP-binding protein [Clostridium senegalense]MBU5226410.1 sensor histidine kinase [Clostridium senegalense]
MKTFIDGYTENEELITLWIHDIKIPISIIKLIIDENMDLSFEPTLKDIDFQVKNIDDSLNKLLYLTRLDDFDKDFIISNVNVKKIIEKVISKHAKYFISKKLKLKLINLDYYILTDEKWLFFVIDQLISNSIKYVNYNGCILIRCHIENNNLILTIYDNGIGIKQEDLSRVFNKGFTGNNGRVNTKSTGLGLYLVKSLCDKVGYTIFIKSKINCYTAVSIGFPNFSDKEI